MKYWLDEEKRKKFVDDLWALYKETNDPDYLAEMLGVGVFKENGIPDEIAKEMAEWLEALNKNGAEEKNTFSSLTDERNEFIFQTYFQIKDCLPILATNNLDRKKREFEDGEARRLVQHLLQKEKNHFM